LTEKTPDFLTTLETLIRDRIDSPIKGSYTSELIAAGQKRMMAQKVGEEAVELALASVSGDRGETIDEAADLLYHVLVLLHSQGIELADVVATLASRHKA
jgi:phosphoribosyl-ATP pyrophosphohydrolase/phosphoribosyl-AMP cyclohydrolase